MYKSNTTNLSAVSFSTENLLMSHVCCDVFELQGNLISIEIDLQRLGGYGTLRKKC